MPITKKLRNAIKELPTEEEMKELSPEELEYLLIHLKELNHKLGNGTLTTLKECTRRCEEMVKLAGDINAQLKQQ